MKLFVNDILERLSEAGHEPKRFIIKKIKTPKNTKNSIQYGRISKIIKSK